MATKLPVPFEPVPVRPRHDGWTAERQIAFIEKLADCGSISAAAKHVGMSRESVRKLRRRPFGRPFRRCRHLPIGRILDCSGAGGWTDRRFPVARVGSR